MDKDKHFLKLELEAALEFEFPETLELKLTHRTVANQDVVIVLSQNKAKQYLGVLPGLLKGYGGLSYQHRNGV